MKRTSPFFAYPARLEELRAAAILMTGEPYRLTRVQRGRRARAVLRPFYVGSTAPCYVLWRSPNGFWVVVRPRERVVDMGATRRLYRHLPFPGSVARSRPLRRPTIVATSARPVRFRTAAGENWVDAG